MRDLVAGLCMASPQCISREKMVQASSHSYLTKLESLYHLYADCIQPHADGIKMVRALAAMVAGN